MQLSLNHLHNDHLETKPKKLYREQVYGSDLLIDLIDSFPFSINLTKNRFMILQFQTHFNIVIAKQYLLLHEVTTSNLVLQSGVSGSAYAHRNYFSLRSGQNQAISAETRRFTINFILAV